MRGIRVVIGNDNKKMGFATLEDKYSTIEVAIYSPAYERYKTLFAEDSFVVVKGTLGEARDGYKITLREIINPHAQKEQEEAPSLPQTNVTLWLRMDNNDAELYEKVTRVLAQYEGDIPVKFKIEGKPFASERRVRRCGGIEYELHNLLGEENVVFFEK